MTRLKTTELLKTNVFRHSMEDFNVTSAKMIRNWILIKNIYDPEKINTESGIDLIADVTFNPAEHMPRIYKVISVPDKLNGRADWKTELDVKSGDDVAIDYMAIIEARKFGRMLVNKEDIYYIIEYYSIYAKKSGKKIIPVNGNVLVRPIENYDIKESSIEIPEYLKEKGNKWGIVMSFDKPLEYRHKQDQDTLNIVEGDLIHTKDDFHVPLELPLKREWFDHEVWVMKRKDILYVKRGEEIQV